MFPGGKKFKIGCYLSEFKDKNGKFLAKILDDLEQRVTSFDTDDRERILFLNLNNAEQAKTLLEKGYTYEEKVIKFFETISNNKNIINIPLPTLGGMGFKEGIEIVTTELKNTDT
ncbi:hypothetical protein BB558_006644 [Smittium angustum]|uniref:Uncharacterized protein n=1 Tax=Smittium angustum TaxID=133377 RepID=A0A2U1IX81_SMIAN|nr:hypothetical protein BB558_006644 [Smittium angustum]